MSDMPAPPRAPRRADRDVPPAIRRTRVLFIGEAVTLSHVGRPSVLAAALDPARFDIVFACEERLRPLLQEHPAYHYVPLRSRIHGTDLDRLTDLTEELFSLATLQAYIAEDLALLNRYHPDVVVGDMRLSLNLSARLAGTPYLNIQSCYWHPQSAIRLRVPANPFGAALSSSQVDALTNVFAPIATLYPNLLALRYGLPLPGPDFRKSLCDGDHIGFPDIPEWSPLARTPANATYLGPLLWAPAVSAPPWWDQIDTASQTVYVSLGSSGQPRLLDSIVTAVTSLGYQVILATAGRARIASVPGQVHVADYLDGSAAAGRSVLTICNGGSTAAPQALAAGCPVLGITSNMDQAAFMHLLARTGAGLELPESHADGGSVAAALRTVLHDPAYRAAAERMRSAISAIDVGAALERAIFACIGARPRGARVA